MQIQHILHILLSSAIAASSTALYGAIEILSPINNAEVPVLNEMNRAFIAANAADRTKMIFERREEMLKAGSTPECLNLVWRHTPEKDKKTAKSFMVTIRRKADDSLFFHRLTSATNMTLDNFEIGCEYVLRVAAYAAKVGEYDVATLNFHTADIAPRVMRVDGVKNVRDLGGWHIAGGKRIRQGMIYRSQAFNDNVAYFSKRDENGMKTAKPQSEWTPGKIRGTPQSRRECRLALGIKTEIDFRRPENETWRVTASPLGSSVAYCPIPTRGHYGNSTNATAKIQFAKAFRLLTDEKNYPVDFHCIAGADRTGTFAYLLGALLGMSADDLARDYYFTCFVNSMPWPKLSGNDYRFNDTVKVIAAYPGETTAKKAENFFLDCGIGQCEIDAFKRIMLAENTVSAKPVTHERFLSLNERERREMLFDVTARKKMHELGSPSNMIVGSSIRWCPAVGNMRDLGGWQAMNGKRIRYGLLWRSARFDEKNANLEAMVKNLGIKTDLDLREPGKNQLGHGTKYINMSAPAYASAIEKGQKWFRKVFGELLKKENYPIAFHCAKGADRTGTLAALIELLMGVDEDDVAKDWQLTAFYNGNTLFEDTRYDSLMNALAKYAGDTWQKKAESFAHSCGISDDEISALREWLLEAPVAEFGVVSDTHICGKKSISCGKLGYNAGCEAAFEWFALKGVDAVVNAGDVAERGNLEETLLYRKIFDKAFINGKCRDGKRAVEHVSVWGNHDALDASYLRKLDMSEELTTSMIRNQSEANRNIDGIARDKWWFDRTVHGVKFIGVDWKHETDCREAMEKALAAVSPNDFVIYLRHSGATNDVFWLQLAERGNALRLSGHNHKPLDSNATFSTNRVPLAIACASTMVLGGKHGGGVGRLGTKPRHASILRIWHDRITFERRELVNGEPLGGELTFFK